MASKTCCISSGFNVEYHPLFFVFTASYLPVLAVASVECPKSLVQLGQQQFPVTAWQQLVAYPWKHNGGSICNSVIQDVIITKTLQQSYSLSFLLLLL